MLTSFAKWLASLTNYSRLRLPKWLATLANLIKAVLQLGAQRQLVSEANLLARSAYLGAERQLARHQPSIFIS
jgi:hypothetical protein